MTIYGQLSHSRLTIYGVVFVYSRQHRRLSSPTVIFFKICVNQLLDNF
jgi:hypothetical protein